MCLSMTVDSFSEELIHNVLNPYSNKGIKINQVSHSSYVEGSRKSMSSNAIYSFLHNTINRQLVQILIFIKVDPEKCTR